MRELTKAQKAIVENAHKARYFPFTCDCPHYNHPEPGWYLKSRFVSKEDKEALKNLKSDDVKDVRIDKLDLSKEMDAANMGPLERKRRRDEERNRNS